MDTTTTGTTVTDSSEIPGSMDIETTTTMVEIMVESGAIKTTIGHIQIVGTTTDTTLVLDSPLVAAVHASISGSDGNNVAKQDLAASLFAELV
jgi:hypothetical protein